VNESIASRVRAVRERIEAACARAGRRAGEITLVGVTKTCGPEIVDALIAAGVSDIGESRIQEFLQKKPRVTKPCRWHFIGTLQRNKASKAVGEFEMIQSVDSLRLAETLARLSVEGGIVTRALLEVNTSGESTKHGFDPGEIDSALERIARLDGIQLEGLMTIGPFTDDPGKIRRAFADLRGMRERSERLLGRSLPHLSMGMTDDFEIAIEEGATIVRLGRILVGERAQ